MNNIDAVDFSEWRSEEVMFLLTFSVDLIRHRDEFGDPNFRSSKGKGKWLKF